MCEFDRGLTNVHSLRYIVVSEVRVESRVHARNPSHYNYMRTCRTESFFHDLSGRGEEAGDDMDKCLHSKLMGALRKN